jgi:cobyric acid synthase CobQ/L-threonine-O-3-phosphate decarboxylase
MKYGILCALRGGSFVLGDVMRQAWTHGGNLRQIEQQSGRASDQILDFSANINPLGFPEWLRMVVNGSIENLRHYPDPESSALREAAARRYGITTEELVAGNGSCELLYALPAVLAFRRGVIAEPCYSDYKIALRQGGLEIVSLPLVPESDFALDFQALNHALTDISGSAVVVLGRPNNPTGQSFSADKLRSLASRHPEKWFLIDEAFGDFVEGFDSLTRDRPSNVMVLLSLTKNFAIPGLRLGLLVADPEIAHRLRALLPPWSVNVLAQAVGTAALEDEAYRLETRHTVTKLRECLAARLKRIAALHVFPGGANFLLLRLQHIGLSVEELSRRLLSQGIAIRCCANFPGLSDLYFRVAVRTAEENDRLCRALETELCGAPAIVFRRPVPAVMFQATSSNAGKSVLTAALCRILLQDGFSVAPFKAQNMSLNSFVTPDGLELGRAQALQAQACRLEADVRMNPVLLKPNSDTGSQVIVMGKPLANMEVGEYFRKKKELVDVVHTAYDELASEHEVMVLEGAGSPAEVNLKSHDIVNMSMAFYAKAPVLMVGDIDRGGVFASFVGSMDVFTERERAQVAGFVVNRFRGQASLLNPAFEYLQRYTGRPVLGVVPFLRDLGLPEEDSVTFKDSHSGVASQDGKLDIVLVDLPHISNFTDCDALRQEPDVALRVVRSGSELGKPDAVILPGSRNVPGDLHALKENGVAAALQELAKARQCEIVGVCGGFQMLGHSIDDPYSLESAGECVQALGLLPVRTTLAEEKVLKRTRGRDLATGRDVFGYEIHHGQTGLGDSLPAFMDESGEPQGARTADGLIWGSYLHGMFDADEFRRAFLDRLRKRAGRSPLGRVVAPYDLEPALERLAQQVRESLPIARIYSLMGLR